MLRTRLLAMALAAGLVGACDVVEKDELRRIRHVDRAVRFVERVLAGGNDRERRAIRAELRPHRLSGDEVRVCRQARIQILLNGVLDRGWRDELPGRQRDQRMVPSAVVVVIIVAVTVLANLVLWMTVRLLKIGVCRQGKQCCRRERAQLAQMPRRTFRHFEVLSSRSI